MNAQHSTVNATAQAQTLSRRMTKQCGAPMPWHAMALALAWTGTAARVARYNCTSCAGAVVNMQLGGRRLHK